MSRSRNYLRINQQRIEWQPDQRRWYVLSPDGQLIQSFKDKYEATMFAAKNRQYARLNRQKWMSSRQTAQNNNDDATSMLYGLFILAGISPGFGAFLTLLILIAVIGIGIPLTTEIVSAVMGTEVGVALTFGDIVEAVALGYLVLLALGTLISTALNRFLPNRGNLILTILVTPLYVSTQLVIPLGFVGGIIMVVLSGLGVVQLNALDVLFFSFLWLLAIHAIGRVLFNLTMTIVER